MRYKYLKLGSMWIRIFLLTTSIVAIMTLVLWHNSIDWINQIDAEVVSAYQAHYNFRLNEAVKIVSQDSHKGAELLIELLNDLKDIQKRDRLARIKRTAFAELIRALDIQGKKAQSLLWAERWVDFDELDLFARLRLSKLLYHTHGREKEGKTLLEEIYKKIPESSLVAEEYAKRLYEEGNTVEAFIAANRIYSAQDSLSGQFWQIFWDTGLGFNERQRKDLLPVLSSDGILSMPIDLPLDAKMLRIDPPISSRIVISEPKLISVQNNKERTLNLWEIALNFSDMTQQGAIIKTSGHEDPYFYFSLPHDFNYGGNIRGRFMARVKEAYPEIMVKIAEVSDIDSLSASLNKRNESEAAIQLLHLVSEKK